jgi:hypothetical protein
MKKNVWQKCALALVLVAVVACKAGPPAIKDLKVGKDKDVTSPANAFGAHDTVYAVANIDNPPSNGKVTGHLVIVDVPGQQAGPIPGLEATVALTGALNQANFNFSAPTAGWPNGKYSIQVTLADASGAQKDQKSAEFTTSGNAPAAAATDTTATTDSASTENTATDTAATDTKQ